MIRHSDHLPLLELAPDVKMPPGRISVQRRRRFLLLLMIAAGCSASSTAEVEPIDTALEGAQVPIATYSFSGEGPMAELLGTLALIEPCVYVDDDFDRRYLLVLPEETSSWASNSGSLNVAERVFRNGARVSVGGSGAEDRPEGVAYYRTDLVTAPDESCDTRNVWVANSLRLSG